MDMHEGHSGDGICADQSCDEGSDSSTSHRLGIEVISRLERGAHGNELRRGTEDTVAGLRVVSHHSRVNSRSVSSGVSDQIDSFEFECAGRGVTGSLETPSAEQRPCEKK